MDYAAQTHQGKKRENNEDAYFVDVDQGVYIVADGMGGHQAGEIASQLAVETIGESIRESENGIDDEGEFLRDAIMDAHQAVYDEAHREERRRGMGTTLVAGYIPHAEEKLFLSHVGDSRAYLFREGKLKQLTEDHTIERNISGRQGDTKPLNPKPTQHVLSQAVGRGRVLAPSRLQVSLQKGDRLLLCTDGLTNGVPEDDIIEILSTTTEPLPALCQQLVDIANRLDGSDNVTVMVIDI